MSNIKVFVDWDSPAVFAGGEVHCTITIKNTFTSSSPRPKHPVQNRARNVVSDKTIWNSKSSHQHSVDHPFNIFPGPAGVRRPIKQRYRSSLSSNAWPGASRSSFETNEDSDADSPGRNQGQHGPLSMFPLSQSTHAKVANHQVTATDHPKGSHLRVTSLPSAPQYVNLVDAGNVAPGTEVLSTKAASVCSPSRAVPIPKLSSAIQHPQKAKPSFIPNLASEDEQHPDLLHILKFRKQNKCLNDHSHSSKLSKPNAMSSSINTHDDFTLSTSDCSLPTHIPEDSSISPNTETPNSSLNSVPECKTNPCCQPFPCEHSPQLAPAAPTLNQSVSLETVMMGYVQMVGSFTLDGSLIALAPFNRVKKMGVVGSQGSGGILSLNASESDGGLLHAVDWSNLGDSIGNFLGSSELSSMRDMKNSNNDNSMSILSTPPSILFVNLALGPGESKAYSCRYTLPPGIPPSHEGRIIRVGYQLIIGIQRAKSSKNHHFVQHLNVPFRVLPDVHGQGDVPGHDLMLPHIMLDNTARLQSMDGGFSKSSPQFSAENRGNADRCQSEFVAYANDLLAGSRQTSTTDIPSLMNKSPVKDEVSTAGETTQSPSPPKPAFPLDRLPYRFEIKRGGSRVAIITLARRSFLLGENIAIMIDFGDAIAGCYSLKVTLERSETVDAAIALRSESSIQRATCHVHAVWLELTACTEKAVFSFIIPITATPAFTTSAVKLEWMLRFEFVTMQNVDKANATVDRLKDIKQDAGNFFPSTLSNLRLEYFDVTIPLQVYGAVDICNKN